MVRRMGYCDAKRVCQTRCLMVSGKQDAADRRHGNRPAGKPGGRKPKHRATHNGKEKGLVCLGLFWHGLSSVCS